MRMSMYNAELHKSVGMSGSVSMDYICLFSYDCDAAAAF